VTMLVTIEKRDLLFRERKRKKKGGTQSKVDQEKEYGDRRLLNGAGNDLRSAPEGGKRKKGEKKERFISPGPIAYVEPFFFEKRKRKGKWG